ncbi:MAG: hypothetical protein LBF38_07510 [Deltaproteobacteria bacterium]|nr:hypothetical protein [Deltaproteobacteria bacterium]
MITQEVQIKMILYPSESMQEAISNDYKGVNVRFRFSGEGNLFYAHMRQSCDFEPRITFYPINGGISWVKVESKDVGEFDRIVEAVNQWLANNELTPLPRKVERVTSFDYTKKMGKKG